VGFITGTIVAPRERPDKAELKAAVEARVVALWSNLVRARFCEDNPHLKTNRHQSGGTAFEYGLCPTPAIFVFQIAHYCAYRVFGRDNIHASDARLKSAVNSLNRERGKVLGFEERRATVG
jgi:hypothetical protein